MISRLSSTSAHHPELIHNLLRVHVDWWWSPSNHTLATVSMRERSVAAVLIHNTLSAHGSKARKQSFHALDILSWTDLNRVTKNFAKTQTQNTDECLCQYSFYSIIWQGSCWNLWLIGLFKRANEQFAKQEEIIIRFVPNDATLGATAGLIMRHRRRNTAAQHNTTQPSTAAIRFAVARKPITAPAHHVGSYEGCREAADLVQYLSCLCGFPPRRVTGCWCAGRKVRLFFFYPPTFPPHEYIAGVSTSVILPHDAWDPSTWGKKWRRGKQQKKKIPHSVEVSPNLGRIFMRENHRRGCVENSFTYSYTGTFLIYTS